MKRDTENYNCSRFRERYGQRGEGATSWVRGGNGLGAVAARGDNRGTVCTHGRWFSHKRCLGSDLGMQFRVSAHGPRGASIWLLTSLELFILNTQKYILKVSKKEKNMYI
jgi:hypothetical protein